ncbi:L-idonate 5-dehydrogenase [Halomonas citrativorans]|uniref:L-idonate 5-dehydrogenase n=1 Tax=Halomonas citrativorans TaxID=2742612 RepID=A0ABR9FD66_9GAMM|nr:L-idonate 5-dehydrogenase [Halomonas citrativorans]MBE0403687.1 L-idonate 5-dehydrogenase [Halomonas citrativorans]
MQALVIHGKQDLREENIDLPALAPGKVRLRMSFGGICGSDLHYYHEGANGAFVVREPLIPGHEMSGVVDEDPTGQWPLGTPVTLHPATFGQSQTGIEDKPHLWPNGAYLGSASTWPHTQGGMSQFLDVDASMLRALPDTLPLKRAALAEPLAVGLHGIEVAGGVDQKRVLVCGAGPIGLLAAAAALARGAKEVCITDILEGPLSRAKILGVHRTIQVDREELPEEAFDVVLECTGVPVSINNAILAVRRAGVIAQIGMMPAAPQPIALASLIAKEVQLRGCFRFNNEIDEAIALLAANSNFDHVITHVLPAADAQQAFAIAKDAEVSGKVLIELWK